MWYSMYYSMNDMKEQLTMNGIMMSNGEILGIEVMAEHNKTDNTIRYSYLSDVGPRWGTVNYNPTMFTTMYDSNNKINGLLSNKPDPANEWYLFWDNN